MTSLSGKTLFITGASRGIGLAIALRAARDGANIAIAAKSDVRNPKLPADPRRRQGCRTRPGQALALKCDIRERIRCAPPSRCVRCLRGIDILVNNATRSGCAARSTRR